MGYEFQVLKRAREDVHKAASWYDKHLPGLGMRFLTEVVNAFERVEANPLHYEIRYSKHFRFARVTDFP